MNEGFGEAQERILWRMLKHELNAAQALPHDKETANGLPMIEASGILYQVYFNGDGATVAIALPMEKGFGWQVVARVLVTGLRSEDTVQAIVGMFRNRKRE